MIDKLHANILCYITNPGAVTSTGRRLRKEVDSSTIIVTVLTSTVDSRTAGTANTLPTPARKFLNFNYNSRDQNLA